MTKALGRKFLSICGIVTVMAGLSFVALPASAAGIVPDCAAHPGTSAPSLNCAMQTFGNIAQLLLGITGSFALLMFVYGGFTLLTSAGSSEKVTKGKTIVTNAVIGIVIIMASGLLINYGLSKIGVKTPVIGQSCKDGGVYVQVPSGAIECKRFCTDPKTTDCFDSASGKLRK